MSIIGLKVWIDLECDPTPDQEARIKSLASFDELDEWDETVRASFWLENPNQIPAVERAVDQILGRLL